MYRALPLHSQMPREDQRKVFEPVPEGVTKVYITQETVILLILTINFNYRKDKFRRCIYCLCRNKLNRMFCYRNLF